MPIAAGTMSRADDPELRSADGGGGSTRASSLVRRGGSRSIFAFVVVNEWLAGAIAVMAILLFFQHRENIARLMAGTEPKIGSEKKAG